MKMAGGKALRQGRYIFSVMHFPAIYFGPIFFFLGGWGVGICWARELFDTLHVNVTTEKKELKKKTPLFHTISDCCSKNTF